MVEMSKEEKNSGISEVVSMFLIRAISFSKKVTNVFARSSAEQLVGKLFSAFLWRTRSIERNRALLSLPASEIRLEW